MTLEEAKESIMRYVEHGIPTGGFLRACLENDLLGAMGRADLTSRMNLFEICAFIYNEIPSTCHGSPDKVKTWLFEKDVERRSKAQENQPA